MQWLKQNRKDLVPEWVDFSKDYDELKWKNPKTMDFNTYFWFSAYNFIIMFYGFETCLFLTAGLIMVYFWVKGWAILIIMPIIIMGYAAANFYKKIKQYQAIKGMTMYSYHLKD